MDTAKTVKRGSSDVYIRKKQEKISFDVWVFREHHLQRQEIFWTIFAPFSEILSWNETVIPKK